MMLPTVMSTTAMMVVMMTATEGYVETEVRAMIMWRRDVDGRWINDRRGRIDHGSWLIEDWRRLNDDGLLHDDALDHRLGINNGLWLRLDDDLRCWSVDNRRRLRDDHRSRMHINRRWRINANRLRLECPGQQQARSHACHNFTSGGPFLIARIDTRNRSSEQSERCDCH